MVFRIEKNKNYTVMSNYHLKDKNLSLKAKGLLSWMLSNDDSWDYSINGIVSVMKENETAIKSALSELKEFGYLVVNKNMPNETQSGRIEYEYIVYENPKQGGENQPLEFLYVENQVQINTNKINTKKENTLSKDSVRDQVSSEQCDFDFGVSEEKPKKKTNADEYSEAVLLINNFTSDLELKKLLHELLANRVDIAGKERHHFYASTFKHYLDELSKIDDKIGAVKLSLQYNNTLKVMKPNTKVTNKRSGYIVPTNSDGTRYVQKKADPNIVARDENGNPIEF